ncbi:MULTISPECIES: ArpU family phage packaging/lysis transcriptional regulator [Bacillaceae]|uniref:ArpU family phage packaging/lysis transcriptional regulator n=1 Tax=Bacillaceae TaxID=186817 RepID=UPI00203F08D4|nr:ArpU family phage packaging/lysis transcriptional regulator [Caldibacillus thermoamylovorans]MCM3053685.1 ArpU family transcriptional regulator [Caldibacillus thermoamylovorans]
MDLLVQGIDERKVRNIVVKELKEFKALRIAMENKKEIEEEGLEILFPMLNNNEKEKIIKFKQINRAINEALDEIEREIIDKKYLSTTRVKDIELYLDMGITKDQYYMYKKQAIFQIATALRII